MSYNPYNEYLDSLHKFCHIASLDNTHAVFTAVSEIDNSLSIVKAQKNDMSNFEVYKIPELTTQGIKWIKAEIDGFIYILSEEPNRVYVTKMNITNGEVVWTKLIASNSFDYPLMQSTDIVYNSNGNYLVVSGYREKSIDDKQSFFVTLLSDGSEISERTSITDIKGRSTSLGIFCDEFSDASYIYGAEAIDTSITSACIYGINEKYVTNKIGGYVFLDDNQNGIRDTNEMNIAIGSININGDYDTYIRPDGTFEISISQDINTLSYSLIENWALSTDSISYTIDGTDQNALNEDLIFGVYPLTEEDIVEPCIIFMDPVVCNANVDGLVQVKNTGSSFQDVLLKVDRWLEPEFFAPQPDSVEINALYWNFQDLAPETQEIILFDYEVPSVYAIGLPLNLEAEVFLLDSINQTKLDSFDFVNDEIVLCAYDPNDKRVVPSGIGEEGFTLFDQTFQYTIRFQNTGNYPAQNIRITDLIDDNLDLSTFEFLAASHEITEINKQERVIEFVFDNIFLPDSVNNEPESHGFVSFRIKHSENLAEGTLIQNDASIYFDLNPPIITNKTTNTLVTELPIIFDPTQEEEIFKLFPNPVTDFLNIEILESKVAEPDWFIYDTMGRKLLSGTLTEVKSSIDTKALSKGIYFIQISEAQAQKFVLMR